MPDRLTYFGEVRANWRFLAAASVGLAVGYSFNNFITNLFTPHLLKEFNWSRSDLALISGATFVAILTLPIAGRLTDRFGVKRVALVGVVVTPIIYMALSAMTGGLLLYFMLIFAQIIIVGGTTSAMTWSRLIAQQFSSARGMALAIANCAPAVAGALSVPFLANIIETQGWRAGYVAAAIGTAVAGVTALLLIPARAESRPIVRSKTRDPSGSYRVIMRNPAFPLIIIGMILCNFSFTMQTTQLKVILLDRGLDSAFGTWAISAFAAAVVAGRFVCGLALDRFPTHVVAALGLGLPGLGLLLLASGTTVPALIVVCVLLLGLSMGAEGDLLAYVVMRFFRLEIYSTVLGMVLAAVALSVGSGALILGFVLKQTSNYIPFLIFTGIAAIIGGGMFYLLKRVPHEPLPQSAPAH